MKIRVPTTNATPSTIANVLMMSRTLRPSSDFQAACSISRWWSARGPRRGARRGLHLLENAFAVGLAHLAHDPAVAEEHDPVGVRGRDRVVGDHHDRLPELVDGAAEQPEHLGAGLRVEVAGRLVGEHDRRPAGEGPGDRDALLLAAGELVRPVPQPVADATASSTPSYHSWSGLRRAMLSGSRMFSSAVSVGTRLNDWKTNPIWSRRSRVSALSPSDAELLVADHHLARGRGVQRRAAVHQRRLARPGRPHDRGEDTRLDVERDPVERPHLGRTRAVGLHQVGHPGRRAPTAHAQTLARRPASPASEKPPSVPWRTPGRSR